MFLTIIVFLVVLTFLVFVHELGHFLTARKFGAKVEEFGLGIPPRVVGVYKKQGKWRVVWGNKSIDPSLPSTVYSLNALPIGGFVRIKGEDGQSTDSDSFAVKKPYQRFFILVAGVVMNFITAIVLFSIIFMVGINMPYDINNPVNIGDKVFVQIGNVLKDSPANKSGVVPGDIVVSVNGKEIENTVQFSKIVSTSDKVDLVLKRDKAEVSVSIIPEYIEEAQGRKAIGVEIVDTTFVRYNPFSALVQGTITTVNVTGKMGKALGEIVYGLFQGEKPTEEVAGPVGIAVYTKKAMDMGLSTLLQFAALLSLNLAVINIIPFPALDGGRILFIIIEKILRRPVSQKVEGIVHTVGFSLLILLIIIITVKDVKNIDKIKNSLGVEQQAVEEGK